jgi:hypothetical protein
MDATQQSMIHEGHTKHLISKETHLQTQIDNRDKQEDIIWKQKSRVQWLEEGDRNSKLFHIDVIKIEFSIKDTQGNQIAEHVEIEQELVHYFKNMLYEPQNNITEAVLKINSKIHNPISHEGNESLLNPTTL